MVSSRKSTGRKWDLHNNRGKQTQAVINKLVASRDTSGKTNPSDDKRLNLSKERMERESQRINQDIVDAESIYQQLPDIELVEQVLVGSIISPKDMSTINLNYRVEEGRFDTELVGPLIQKVKEHFNTNYKIEDRIDEMLTRILFRQGADVYVVIPENNLDQLINGNSKLSLEDFRRIESRFQLDKPLGILGHPKQEGVSLENYRGPEVSTIGNLKNIKVTDNFDVLKKSLHSNLKRGVKINELMKQRSVSMEAASKGLTSEEIDKLFKRSDKEQRPSQAMIPSLYQNKPSIGNCFLMNPPMGSMIPVFVPGDPTDHVGYFMLLDSETGRPVQKENGRDYYNEIRTNFNAANNSNADSTASDIVNATREAMGGRSVSNKSSMDEFRKAYETLVENDLVNRFRNGIYGEEFSVGFTNEIYDIMLARSFANKGTQLLYIPAEFVVYMAFDFDDNGVGKSLLKQTSLLSAMRSVLLFADTMSGVKNAIGRKRVTINVDPADPDPERTIRDIQSLILEGTKRGFPIGSPDPAQTMDFLDRAGFDFKINIEGDNYPGTSVDYDDYKTDVSAGNPELEEKLRRLQTSGFGINPEKVDPTQSPDFATSIVNNDLIFTRRVLRYQKRFTNFLTRLIRIITTHSPLLIEEIETTFKEEKAKLSPSQKEVIPKNLVQDFIESIEVSLPSPDTTKVEQQLQAFEQYSQLLDRALEAYINPEIFPDEYLAREPETVNRVISVISAYFKRLWLDRNNVTPELLELVELDDRKPNFDLLQISKTLTGSLGKSIQRYLEGMKKDQERNEKKYGTPDDGGFGDENGVDDSFTDDSLTDTSSSVTDDFDFEGGENDGTQGDETGVEEETSEAEGEDPEQDQEDDEQK